MRLQPSQYRAVTIGALIAVCAIVVSGAAVRLTGSGLGCDDWPNCNDRQLIDVSSTPRRDRAGQPAVHRSGELRRDRRRARLARAGAPPARPHVVVGRAGRRRRRSDRARRCDGARRPAPDRRAGSSPVVDGARRQRDRARAPRRASPTESSATTPSHPATRAAVVRPGRWDVTRRVHRHVGDRRRTTCRRRGRPALRVPHPDRRPRPRHHRDGDDRHRPGPVVADPRAGTPTARR